MQLSADTLRTAAAVIEAALERAVSWDQDSENVEIDGAGHRALFSVGCLLSGSSPDATEEILREMLVLVQTLPVGTNGKQFMTELRDRCSSVSGASASLFH